MGRSALVSHMNGKKHQSIANAISNSDKSSFLNLFSKGKVEPSRSLSSCASTSATATPLPFIPMDSFVSNNNVLEAEIWWSVRTALKNHSASSNSDIDFYFKKMFPGIPIVQKFSCGYTKSSYLMSFGIVPHLKSLLVEEVANEPFSLMFDESLNKSLTQKQLDIHLRYWNSGVVQTRYFDSKMLGHSTANHLLEAINSCKETIDFRHLIHLSMDGPNVNWAMFNKLQMQLKTDYNNNLFNIGSCGLHQLHNALRKGMDTTGWDLPHVLTSAYYLFKHMPARREDFISVTGSSTFPSKYCGHRWVENQSVLIKLKECLPFLKMYIKAVKDKKITDPASKPYHAVKTFLEDPLCEMKLAFAITLCKPVEKFLTVYQTDRPMVPFLYNDLNNLLLNMTKRIAKIDNAKDMTEINLENKDILLELSKVNIGTEAAELLKKSKAVSPRMMLEFWSCCRDAILATIFKLLKKSPLSYSLCKHLQFLDPELIINKPKSATRHIKSALLLGIHCPLSDIDDIVDEYDKFINKVKSKESFLNFKPSEDRIDKLLFNEVACQPDLSKLWFFIKKCLVISHGQAAVERGFSENNLALETNMGEKILIARRTIKDYVRHIGGIEQFNVSENLLKSCGLASRRYKAYLEEKKSSEEKSGKRKRTEEEVIGLKRRKVELAENAAFLRKESEKQSDKAEEVKGMKEQLALFTTANALRKAAKEKEDELASVSKELEEKEASLKS